MILLQLCYKSYAHLSALLESIMSHLGDLDSNTPPQDRLSLSLVFPASTLWFFGKVRVVVIINFTFVISEDRTYAQSVVLITYYNYATKVLE